MLSLTHNSSSGSDQRKICAKKVLRNLSQDQMIIKKERCLNFLESILRDPHFLERIVTGEETGVWV